MRGGDAPASQPDAAGNLDMTREIAEFPHTTFTVKASNWARRADGRVALLLYPEETAPQPVAFEIDLDAIGSIRRHLDAAEEFLGSKVGHA
jgi:hypothetical protein